MPIVRVRARVTGVVQGVWYRGSTRERAGELGLVGWVRNLRDGSVELEAEGEQAVVDQLLAWCKQGPPAARVGGVDVEGLEPAGGESGFEVRY
jgi:acylphosphatase